MFFAVGKICDELSKQQLDSHWLWTFRRILTPHSTFALPSRTHHQRTSRNVCRRNSACYFKEATARAHRIGFDIIELHGAHGYLIHEFLSPLSNKRTDSYGGSFENRIRFLVQVVTVVRQEWPQDKPLWVRISVTDWVEGGWNDDDSVMLGKILKDLGVDLIDCSSSGVSDAQKSNLFVADQVPFAARIKRESGIDTGAVGMITDPELANEIIEEGRADVILLGREFLRNPYWPIHAAMKLGLKGLWPKQYLWAVGKL